MTVLFALLLTSSMSFAQLLEQTLNKYADSRQPERLYIHYDKTSYVPGETIWYKAYFLSGIMPAEKSKTLYIDWYDDNGKLVFRTTDPIVDGISYGQFDLPETYPSPVLHVKAYTRWMLNFDSAFLYHKNIPILVADSLKHKRALSKPELTLFPEGGDLVSGLLGKVAFKANDQYGIPVNVSGYITTEDSEKAMDSLRVIHDGMGYFYLTPEKGKNYRVVWFDENKVKHEQNLPHVMDEGLTIQVGMLPEKRSFSIHTNPDGSLARQNIHIIGTMYQQPVFNITRSFEDGAIQGIIPTVSLPTGILTSPY